VSHIPVTSTFTGHGNVAERPRLYLKNGVQFAQGPAIMVSCELLTVSVMRVGATPFRLTNKKTVGYMDPYDGPTYCSLLNVFGLSPSKMQSARNPAGQQHVSG